MVTPYGSSCSIRKERPTNTPQPRSAASAINSSRSRVFPIQAAPVRATVVPPLAARPSAWTRPSSSVARSMRSVPGRRPRAVSARTRRRTPGAGGRSSSRMASYSSVVSSRGATPSSSSKAVTQFRYTSIAPGRSPAQAWSNIRKRCAGSWSGSSSIQRLTAEIAARYSPAAASAVPSLSKAVPTWRRVDSETLLTQSSNSGEAFTEKPSRNSPRYSSVARRRRGMQRLHTSLRS